MDLGLTIESHGLSTLSRCTMLLVHLPMTPVVASRKRFVLQQSGLPGSNKSDSAGQRSICQEATNLTRRIYILNTRCLYRVLSIQLIAFFQEQNQVGKVQKISWKKCAPCMWLETIML